MPLGSCRRSAENNTETVFIDLTKAFDMVSRSGLWLLLRKFGCTELFEAKRLAAMGEKRATRKNRLQQQQQAGAGNGVPSFVCGVCQRDCHSRIGLVSHSRTHRT